MDNLRNVAPLGDPIEITVSWDLENCGKGSCPCQTAAGSPSNLCLFRSFGGGD